MKLLKAILLLLVAAGIGAWAWKTFAPTGDSAADAAKPAGTQSEAQAPADAPAHGVVVTYFADDHPCPTCLKIEKLTREAVDSGFSKDLASGELRFQKLNMDRPENKHLVEEYELSFKTVVISERENGEKTAWEKFDKVWDLVGDPDAFTAYIQDGIREHLKNTKSTEPDA